MKYSAQTPSIRNFIGKILISTRKKDIVHFFSTSQAFVTRKSTKILLFQFRIPKTFDIFFCYAYFRTTSLISTDDNCLSSFSKVAILILCCFIVYFGEFRKRKNFSLIVIIFSHTFLLNSTCFQSNSLPYLFIFNMNSTEILRV